MLEKTAPLFSPHSATQCIVVSAIRLLACFKFFFVWPQVRPIGLFDLSARPAVRLFSVYHLAVSLCCYLVNRERCEWTI